MKIYKLAFASLVAGFATAAIANELSATSVSNRKTCDEIAAEIATLSAIVEPDAETVTELTKLKQQQRSACQKRAGTRGAKSIARQRIPTAAQSDATETKSETPTTPTDKTCDTPDENGCCPGETYTDMGELGFNCCPDTGGDCFPPIKVTVEPEPEPELTDEEKNANLESGLCADGTAPNKFGCCNDEIFKDMGDAIFACCPKSGGDCFPPIK